MLFFKAELHGSQFWRQFFLKSASGFQYSNLIGCVHANYDVIVNILGVRYLENRRTRFRATEMQIIFNAVSGSSGPVPVTPIGGKECITQ